MSGIDNIRGILDSIPKDSIPEEKRTAINLELENLKQNFEKQSIQNEKSIKERNNIQKLLKKTSSDLIQRQRSIFNKIAMPLVIVSENGTITHANSSFFTLTGYSWNEIIEKTSIFTIIETQKSILIQDFYHNWRIEGGQTSTLETSIVRKDGQKRDALISFGLLDNKNESIITITDITERNTDRNELKKHNERLEVLNNLYLMTSEQEYYTIKYTLKKIIEITQSKHSFIILINSEEDLLTLEGIESEESITELKIILSKMTYTFDEVPLIRQVVLSSESLIINRPTVLEKLLPNVTGGPDIIENMMLMPVIDDGKTIGVVGVIGKSSYYERNDEAQATVIFNGLVKNITKQRQYKALTVANKKMSLLLILVRHDTLNLITTLSGYIELAKSSCEDEEAKVFLNKAELAAKEVTNIVDFTRDYEQVGIKHPIWQNVSEQFDLTAKKTYATGLNFENHTKGLWIFADPLLPLVFSNFIDNSVRHGRKVDSVILESEERGDGMLLIYLDNGDGVPDSVKDKIFCRGYGKHTGIGLFLIREIFEITGISIKETGIYGQGVRFEILIPKDKYRLLGL